jgi:hypothetical protein
MPPSLQSDASPKQVVLEYGLSPGAWSAVVTYTGIGAYQHIDTCSWLARWLNPTGKWLTILRFEDALECIRSEGTKWLAEVAKATHCPIPLHSFVVAGFVAHKLHVVLISNFERFGHRPSTTASPELIVTCRRPMKPIVVVTGVGIAVCRDNRRLLCSMLRAQADPKRIRERLADITRLASESPASHGLVSPNAMAFSLLSDGNNSGGEKYGEVEGDYFPHMLFNGFDMRERVQIVLDHMGTGQVISKDNRHG